MIDKRHFLKQCGAVAGVAMFGTANPTLAQVNAIDEDGVRFGWSHKNSRLNCVFSAPTPGWVAVGFNTKHELRGTRFVIATTSHSPLRLEERVALVPGHRRVQDLGFAGAATHSSGAFEDGRSELAFSLPERISGQPGLNLSAGAWTYLMLAWSHGRDFQHHSAWRKHYSVQL